MKRWTKNNTRGDTIVEVMISMTVLAVVIAAAYAISTRSFQSSLNSQYRDQAVSLAQQQLELIKEADNSPSAIATYTASPGQQFCINASSKARQTANSGNCLINSQYTVAVTYDSSSKAFTVTASWDSSDNRTQQTTVYYRPNDSFSGSPPATCVTVSASCTSTQTNVPGVAVSATQATVNVGSTDTISWGTTNIKTGSCTASGPGGFGGVDANANPGTFTTSALNTVGSNVFTIACTDNANNPVSNSTTVNVVAPKPIVATGSASAITYNSATLNGTVNPNGFATTYVFNWGTTASYGTTTAAASAGAGTSNTAASAAISGLNFNTVYHFQVCATNSYGTNCGADATFTTANNPPPVITAFYASPSSINWNTSTTLYWTSTNATSCSRGGSSGSQGTGNLTSTTTYGLTCTGPGGTTPTSYATVSVGAQPPPPCSAWASGSIVSSKTALISGGGSSCSYFYDSVVGWNGGGTWGPTNRPVCHTEQGGADPWGWLSSGSWCSG